MEKITTDFSPSCSLAALQTRAALYATIRQFFAVRGVLEVETPILIAAGAWDVHLQSITASRHLQGKVRQHYLQTSPEFAMKRLLAAGSGAIYQLCKVFRDNEHGMRHNSEFTMLEWYRPSFSLAQLQNEVAQLLRACFALMVTNDALTTTKKLPPPVFRTLSYKQAFFEQVGLNPLTATLADFKSKAHALELKLTLPTAAAYRDLLFAHCVEPQLGRDGVLFLSDFPPDLASLAKTHQDSDGDTVASRFEVYFDGLELANAYDELNDSAVLRQRFAADNASRAQWGLPVMALDERLLAALPLMPACSGVALGIDRLLMVLLQTKNIADVLSFPADKA